MINHWKPVLEADASLIVGSLDWDQRRESNFFWKQPVAQPMMANFGEDES
jgi:hypothetical protein